MTKSTTPLQQHDRKVPHLKRERRDPRKKKEITHPKKAIRRRVISRLAGRVPPKEAGPYPPPQSRSGDSPREHLISRGADCNIARSIVGRARIVGCWGMKIRRKSGECTCGRAARGAGSLGLLPRFLPASLGAYSYAAVGRRYRRCLSDDGVR